MCKGRAPRVTKEMKGSVQWPAVACGGGLWPVVASCGLRLPAGLCRTLWWPAVAFKGLLTPAVAHW